MWYESQHETLLDGMWHRGAVGAAGGAGTERRPVTDRTPKNPHRVTARLRPCFRRRWRVPRDPLPPLRPSPCARRSSWCLLLRWRRCLPVTSSSRGGTCCLPRRPRGGLRHRPGHHSLFNIRHGRDLRFSRRRGRAGRQHRMGGGRCVEVADLWSSRGPARGVGDRRYRRGGRGSCWEGRPFPASAVGGLGAEIGRYFYISSALGDCQRDGGHVFQSRWCYVTLWTQCCSLRHLLNITME